MNKTVMAAAVAGALAAPAVALAQVQIGGGITVLMYQHDPDNNPLASSHDRMESSESELNIRGEENLGGGQSAWFQCATSIDGIIGGNSVTQRGLCTRNSAIGFRGGFGNVFVGNWDTPMKLVQNRARGWFSGTNALYGGGMVLLAGDSSSGLANEGTSFYRRQANSLNYHSPDYGGFTVAGAFSTSNEGDVTPDAAGLTPRLLSLNGAYAAGPLMLAAAYEKHDDFDGLSASDDAFSLVAGYRMGAFNIRGIYQTNTYEIPPSAEVETTGFGLYVDWNIQGPHTLRVAYITLDDVEGTAGATAGSYVVGNGTGGDLITLAYTYDFSKRTQLVAAYNQMKNDANAAFSMGVADARDGGKQTSIGAAIRHSF
jgi:predicted porin